MRRLIRAELLKLTTTRSFWVYVLLALALVPVTIALTILAPHTGPPHTGVTLDSSQGVRRVIAAGSSGALLLVVIGILVMAGEFRHNTATATFLITPDRKRVALAKLAATTLVAIVIAAAASMITLAVALPWLSAKVVNVGAYTGDIGLVILGALTATALFAVIGVGLGAILRNQTHAITIALVWTLTVETLLMSTAPEIYRWLPGGASNAMTPAATLKGGMLPMWAGALLLAAYALAFATAGTRRIANRDIT
jgi:ABC-2 type transport system permease protein